MAAAASLSLPRGAQIAEAADAQRYPQSLAAALPPALVIILFAAIGPLLIVLLYSFLTPGRYGGVVWKPSLDGWFKVLFRDATFSTIRRPSPMLIFRSCGAR